MAKRARYQARVAQDAQLPLGGARLPGSGGVAPVNSRPRAEPATDHIVAGEAVCDDSGLGAVVLAALPFPMEVSGESSDSSASRAPGRVQTVQAQPVVPAVELRNPLEQNAAVLATMESVCDDVSDDEGSEVSIEF